MSKSRFGAEKMEDRVVAKSRWVVIYTLRHPKTKAGQRGMMFFAIGDLADRDVMVRQLRAEGHHVAVFCQKRNRTRA